MKSTWFAALKKKKIELQVPALLDSNSWKRFTFSGYNRGGGKENAAMHFAYLSFRNKDVVYEEIGRAHV